MGSHVSKQGYSFIAAKEVNKSVFKRLFRQAGNPYYFVAAGFTVGYGNGGTRNCKKISQELNYCLVGFALNGWGSQRKLQCITHSSCNGIPARAGMDLDGKCYALRTFLNGNHGVGVGRAPKIAVPTRTQVEPSSMAT